MTRFWKVCARCEYELLMTMVQRHKDQKVRTRNFQARNERIENRSFGKDSTGEECQR